MNIKFISRSMKGFLLYVIVTFCANSSYAARSLSDNPLFLTVSVPPNVVMTLDDSGSMGWGYVPDAFRNEQQRIDGPRFSAASYNPLYYNPFITYDIPTRTDGVSYATSYTRAYINGFDATKGYADISGSSSSLSSPNQNGYRTIVEYFNNKQSACTSYADTDQNTSKCRISKNAVSYICTIKFNKKTLTVYDCGNIFSGNFAPESDTNLSISGASSSNNRTYTISSVVNATRLNFEENFPINETRSNVTISWNKPESVGYYHVYYSDKSGLTEPIGCNSSRNTDACYVRIAVGSSDDIANPNLLGNSLSDRQKQNFANWYSFYRTRNLATISSAIEAISQFSNNAVRLAWQALSACDEFGISDCSEHENRIRPIDAHKHNSSTLTHRSDFYNWVEKLPISGSTPLRTAMIRAGEYFSLDGKNGPYAEDPYVSQGSELSCRKNFHVMFTDGIYNDNLSGIGDMDNQTTTLPDGKNYSARNPYKGSSSNSLADVAFKYWATDLNSNLGNNIVPLITDRSGDETARYWNAKNNPANWQHMVNFTIGLGLTSSLTNPVWGGSTYAGDYEKVVKGEITWPSISTDSNKVYDLWHAALNSRGQFFSADSPDSLNAAFKSVMNSILNGNPSAAALTANSTAIQSGTLIYQARFDSLDWHGQLLAIPVQSGGVVGSAQWDAGSLIPGHSSRNIYTFNGMAGKLFSSCSSSLNTTQKNLLDKDAYGVTDNKCNERLNWIRGDSSKEVRNNGVYRNRTVSILGDIVNSDPMYVKNENYNYDSDSSALTNAEKTTYTTFVSGKASRMPAVYVGANDGMLHAFRSDIGHVNSGKELFAYVPMGVYDNLSKLTNPAYSHKPFVDGPPFVGDAYIGSSWKTVLVSGLNGGGKSIFALDISAPDTFSESNVMWEFTDSDLGYTFSQPQIARLASGQWVAIFGNGYNSGTDKAFLYIVNLSTGELIKKIAVGNSTDNGLSTPYAYDYNNDKIIDYVYAGDLQGSLWKFDLTSSVDASWSIANGGAPLFVASNNNNQAQPITSQPKVAIHPNGGSMVYFGTGSYLTEADVHNLDIQTLYAVRDSASVANITRSSLQQQQITYESTEHGYVVRQTSKNTVDWAGGKQGWYLDLLTPPVPGIVKGERIVSTPLLKYDRVIFVTMIPNSDPCAPGGESWIMELEMLGGAPTLISPFDFNNDGSFDSLDLLQDGNVGSGVKSTVGITKTPVWLDGDCTGNYCMGIKEMSGTTGQIMALKNRGKTPSSGLPVRVYWKQIY